MSTPTATVPTCPLDNLSAGRIADALALRRFLNHVDRLTFVEGSRSAQVLEDLASAGAVRVRRFVHQGIRLAEVMTR